MEIARIKKSKKSLKFKRLQTLNSLKVHELIESYKNSISFIYETHINAEISKITNSDLSFEIEMTLHVLQRQLRVMITDVNYITNTRHIKSQYPELIKSIFQDVLKRVQKRILVNSNINGLTIH